MWKSLQNIARQVLILDDRGYLLANIFRVDDDDLLHAVPRLPFDHRERRSWFFAFFERCRSANLAYNTLFGHFGAWALEQVRGLEADLVQHPFENRMQPPSPNVFSSFVHFKGKLRHLRDGLLGELELHALGLEQGRGLLDQRRLRLGQDAYKVVHRQRLQLDADGKTALQLRDQVAGLRYMEGPGGDEQDMVGRDH